MEEPHNSVLWISSKCLCISLDFANWGYYNFEYFYNDDEKLVFCQAPWELTCRWRGWALVLYLLLKSSLPYSMCDHCINVRFCSCSCVQCCMFPKLDRLYLAVIKAFIISLDFWRTGWSREWYLNILHERLLWWSHQTQTLQDHCQIVSLWKNMETVFVTLRNMSLRHFFPYTCHCWTEFRSCLLFGFCMDIDYDIICIHLDITHAPIEDSCKLKG